MMDSTSRRYLRFDCDVRAVLEPRLGEGTRPDGEAPAATAAPVTVRCLSAGGLGLAFDEWDDCPVATGEPVLVRLLLDGGELALTGEVAWIRPRPHERFDLGVALRLEQVPAEARDQYLALVRRRGGPRALAPRTPVARC